MLNQLDNLATYIKFVESVAPSLSVNEPIRLNPLNGDLGIE